MSTALETSSPPSTDQVLIGVVRGKTIELDCSPGLPEGQRVSVNLWLLRDSNRNQEWPQDVAAFAKEHHVAEFLPNVYEMTRRMFSSARRLEVVLEEDPEIAGQKCIVFQVTVPRLDSTGFLDAERRWVDELFRCCPCTVSSAFSLGLEMAD